MSSSSYTWSSAASLVLSPPASKIDHLSFSSSIADKYTFIYKIIGVFLDLVLLNASAYLVYFLLDLDALKPLNTMHMVVINLLWMYLTRVTGLYRHAVSKEAIPTIKQTIITLFLFGLGVSCLSFYVKEFDLDRKEIVYAALIFAPALVMGKIAFLLFRKAHRDTLVENTKVIIVGAGPVGVELEKVMESRKNLGLRVMGFFDDKPNLQAGDVRVLGGVNDCIAYAKENGIKEIYCALPDRAQSKIKALMLAADREMIRFRLVPDVKDHFHKNVNVRMLGHFPVISPRQEPLELMQNKMAKRVFDIVFSSLVIVFILSWAVPLLALLIKLDSKGPVFFKQLRSGKDNLPFFCLKFRSMRVNEDSDKRQAVKGDHRITRLGAFMRRTSLDELPQFFNVFVGHMSVVGPRPHMLQHTDAYSEMIDRFMVRHFIMPGITGWAQVTGFRGETSEEGSMEARVSADIWYLENWSMLLDLKIAFLTVWQVFAGHKNAY
ncbi:undecaprenyl-phosphate glucose phosphotransferase [Pedobacter faecalis]|uniref:undecaprenyl-phosphate glucose phosphotransferase n=1 Tax=Pedobacter faecalis TaxID=3041495 RepID=UPI00254AD2CF|nr:undecaprenyl-phosphate glucose phosphotransferase [Pedobacter sp. ELA7]